MEKYLAWEAGLVWYCVGGSLYAFCVFLGYVCICIWTFAVLGMMV